MVFVIFIFLGCTKSPNKPLHAKSLEKTILNMNSSIATIDAKILSYELTNYSLKLKKIYELVKPPLYHNFLVNIGAKKRGLCWQFAYDMLAHAKSLNLKSFDYYIGGANIDDYWEEHNTLVVTCKGCDFSKGIVMDPWRNSGVLYFSNVKDDKKYSWSQRGGLR